MFRRVSPVFALAMTKPCLDGIKSQDPTHEDARWLEAQTDELKLKSPEERYAAEKERQLLAKMMSKMRDEHKDHVETVQKAQADKHAAEVSALKEQLASVMGKLDELSKK